MYIFLSYVAPNTFIFPFIAALINLKKLPPVAKALFYYVILSAVSDIFAGQLANRNIDSTPFLHFYTVAELLLLSVFFYRLLNDSKKKGILIMSISFVVFSVINTSFFQPLNQLNTYTRSLEALIMIACCFFYFDQESRRRQSMRWEEKTSNWYVTGLLAYFGGAFFFFLFMNVISNLPIPTQNFIWCLHAVMEVIMYLLIAIGFYKESKYVGALTDSR